MGNLDRPFILFEDGRPTCIFFATPDGTDSFMDAFETWNMAKNPALYFSQRFAILRQRSYCKKALSGGGENGAYSRNRDSEL
ncbi:hypothetical protein AMURIS_02110 [Acetatifactor muris]|uniref:Uncharacterized protein n=1 Tax=Acetatifactor muris TaxID=879566 RepID=A0A2K4ZG12_9FIRM|nr:hypothetical protein AMURIS_02110 [Acetatifactor muris]